MTTEEIIKLAQEFLEEWEADEDGRTWTEYSGTTQKIIDFAEIIYLTGWGEGYKKCLDKLNPSVEDLLNSTKSCKEND